MLCIVENRKIPFLFASKVFWQFQVLHPTLVLLLCHPCPVVLEYSFLLGLSSSPPSTTIIANHVQQLPNYTATEQRLFIQYILHLPSCLTAAVESPVLIIFLLARDVALAVAAIARTRLLLLLLHLPPITLLETRRQMEDTSEGGLRLDVSP